MMGRFSIKHRITQPMRSPTSSLLTTGQAAKLCEVTPDTILKWIRKGRLRGARTAGGHYRIDLRDLEPHIPPSRLEDAPPEGPSGETPQCFLQRLHCWEYLSDQGTIRDECKRCVVYRVRAARCFHMADMATDVGHAKEFCRSSCEDCEYYRRVRGLPTNVLVITPDEAILDRLTAEEVQGITLRVARNAYEASAVVESFQAAFVVIDEELSPADEPRLLESLAADPRLPGVKIVLGVPRGAADARRRAGADAGAYAMLDKPFGVRRIAALIESYPIERSMPLIPNVPVAPPGGESHASNGDKDRGTEAR